MLIPQNLFTVREHDATFVVTPSSRFGHESDTVLAAVEMLIENDQAEEIEFPFVVLTTDSGAGAANRESVEPRVLNGSRPVEIGEDEVDEKALAELMVQRAQAAGVSDPAELEEVRKWGTTVLARAERTRVGRTRIKPGERRRLILQQRLRILPDEQGRFVFETIAPSPIATLATGGRVSIVVLLPWEDEDVRVAILERTDGFEVEQGQVKARKWIAWHWKNDPVFRLVYQYQ
jgi:hypothetical protein